MTDDGPALTPAAVAGLHRSDPRLAGIARVRAGEIFRYLGASGAEITDAGTLDRIRALVIPPAWESVWINPDPLGHIQATGIDSRGRTQYRYHQLWREQRDIQKFDHMLRFADALPTLRAATDRDLHQHRLGRDRVAASAVRLIDLGLFRIGGEKYAELDHHYGATTLEKRHVSFRPDTAVFDYVAKAGKRRTITVTDPAALTTIRALARSDNRLDALFSWRDGDSWQPLHSHDVNAYIADHADGHYTAKEFRTWNATVLMALLLSNARTPTSGRIAVSSIRAGVREVADWLGDTPTVTRASYIDPRIIRLYQTEGGLDDVPARPASLPADPDTELAVGRLLRRLAVDKHLQDARL